MLCFSKHLFYIGWIIPLKHQFNKWNKTGFKSVAIKPKLKVDGSKRCWPINSSFREEIFFLGEDDFFWEKKRVLHCFWKKNLLLQRSRYLFLLGRMKDLLFERKIYLLLRRKMSSSGRRRDLIFKRSRDLVLGQVKIIFFGEERLF